MRNRAVRLVDLYRGPLAVSSTDEGKAAAPYEFGVKASTLAAGGLFVLHARAMLDNPYDGHTSGTSLTAPRN